MKKVILLMLALTFGGKYVIAQDGGENNIKNFRFGLKTAGMLTWYKPDDVKKFTSGGVSARGGYGLMMEFRLNKVASIAMGFQVDYFRGKLDLLDSNYYFLSKDGELLEKTDSVSQTTRFKLNSRVYNTTYVTLPFTLKLKTPEIGVMTYYGQFGINTSVRVGNKVTDEVNFTSWSANKVVTGSGASQAKLDNAKDMNLLMFALNIGAGAEFNVAGSTSFVFGLNWYNGFSNVLKKDSKYLFRTPANNNDPTKQNARCSAIALTIGVLF